MKRIFICVLCAVFSIPFFAAKPNVKEIVYDYVYRSNDRNESQSQAEQHAIEKAKQKALEDYFGLDVSSIVVTMETEHGNDGKYSDEDDFYSLGSTVARGEWIEQRDERVIESRHNGEFWEVKVHVEGTAREKTGTPIDIKYSFISNQFDRESRTIYYDQDDLLMRFTSPVDGMLCVYLVDAEKTAYCLLPLEGNGAGAQEIKANEDYVFFRPEPSLAFPGYKLTTTQKQEQNVIYIIFSPNRITKARDLKGQKNMQGDNLPRNLAYEDFIRWLAKNQTADADLLVRTEHIQIKKIR